VMQKKQLPLGGAYRVTVDPQLAARWLRDGNVGHVAGILGGRVPSIEEEIGYGRRNMPLVIVDGSGQLTAGHRLLRRIAKEGLPRNCFLVTGARPAEGS
jgi:hypothetical protein